jgi:pyruvate/2-oxoglutarate dehydrogenase complex dihydrolipoamide acyltransferase (E2) component
MSDIEFRLPDIGEGLEEAEIVEWLVGIGDQVRRDQPLVEVLTDKSQAELPSPVAGIVASLHYEVGDIATVGDLLVVITSADGSPTTIATTPAERQVPPMPATAPATPAPIEQRRPVKASPAVRRRARTAGIDLAEITGTGPSGRITDDDLAAAAESPVPFGGSPPVPLIAAATPNPAGGEQPLGALPIGTHPLRGVRRATARAMERSWAIPHIHGMDEIDASNLLAGRSRIKELLGERAAGLSVLPFLVTAVARALARYRTMNASIDTEAEGIEVHGAINIGIAVATERGLLVPVLRSAEELDLLTMAGELSRLSKAARDGSISAADMSGGTFTISNYGSLGGRLATPIIRAPEVGIIGFGSIRPRPFVVDGAVVARPTLPIATGCDHRLIDGDLLTAFQEHVIALLTDPVALMVR